MPVAWNEDPPGTEQQIRENAAALLRDIAVEADRRLPPTVAMAQEWHRRLYRDVALPVAYYAGEPRDSDPECPELQGYEVAVGTARGTPSELVPAALAGFEASARHAVSNLDEAIPAGSPPADGRELHGVLSLCAVLHGEWVRIHPFANGNGRTARLWANWAALRYGLPPFVTIKPRPGNPYGMAAMASMNGSHATAVAAFDQMLRGHLVSELRVN
ncbi:MAG TPA: Fic family protein [Solirubrobacterales bacterium]|nr:Fic family protein [Solirubrobacterales bacterium]